METQKFKTNLKCGGCVAAIQKDLDAVAQIDTWEVDLTSIDKVLTVTGNANQEQIIDAFAKAGFVAEPIA